MEADMTTWLVLGGMFVLAALGLSLVKVDKDSLESLSHKNPGMALFRFPLYRWSIVLILASAGLVSLLIGIR